MRIALALLLGTLAAYGFGPGFNPVTHLVPRPPQCWVDIRQYKDTNAPDGTIISSNLWDYSGHGWIWKDNTINATNVQYFTRHDGCMSTLVADNAALTSHGPAAGHYQIMMFTGPGSEFGLRQGKHTNQCTIAMRIFYRTGGGAMTQTGNDGGPNYAYAQNFGGDLYWDFGPSVSAFRINKVRPVGFTNAWWNVFFTRGRTNMSIWHNGTNYHSGMGTSLILGNGTPGNYTLMGMTGITNWYIKRILMWDYELPAADIETWNRRMTELP